MFVGETVLRHFLVVLGVVSLWSPRSCRESGVVRTTSDNAGTAAVKLRLDPRIPPPDPAKYGGIRDGLDWKNPFIHVARDHVTLNCRAASIQYKTVRVEDLARELVALPVSAWPYGKVVAASSSGPAGLGDSPFIEKNRAVVGDILRSLGVTVDWWP